MKAFASCFCRRIALLACAGMLSASAHADTFSFVTTFDPSGSVSGAFFGIVNLPFVTAGGSGTGPASLVFFTSYPSAFGTLVGGPAATSWANQNANSFTVTNGVVTSDLFFASTGTNTAVDSVFCLNSTATTLVRQIYFCNSRTNALETSNTAYGQDFNSTYNITFTDITPAVSTTPEPGSLALLSTGLAGVAETVRRKYKSA